MGQMHKAGRDARVAVPGVPLLRRRMGGTTSLLGKSLALVCVLCPLLICMYFFLLVLLLLLMISISVRAL